MITVGIPTLNGPDRLDRALTAIARTMPRAGVRVVVCDDGSFPDDLKLIKDAVHRHGNGTERSAPLETVLLMNEKRLGVAASFNRLVRHHADADLIVLLHDDVEVEGPWLEALAFSIRENPILGTVSLNARASLTRRQVEDLHPGHPFHVTVNTLEYQEATLWVKTDWLGPVGPIYAFRRSVFDAVGGFDETFRAYDESRDFGLLIRKMGLYHALASQPFVWHQIGATFADPKNGFDAAAERATSRERFVARWGEGLAALRAELRRRDPLPPILRSWSTEEGS